MSKATVGSFDMRYSGRAALEKFDQVARKKMIDSATFSSRELQCNCLVAETAKECAVGIVDRDGSTYSVFNKMASFGADQSGRNFLTVTMRNESAETKRFTWYFPDDHPLVRDSIAHDLGKKYIGRTIRLHLADAVVTDVQKRNRDEYNAKRKSVRPSAHVSTGARRFRRASESVASRG